MKRNLLITALIIFSCSAIYHHFKLKSQLDLQNYITQTGQQLLNKEELLAVTSQSWKLVTLKTEDGEKKPVQWHEPSIQYSDETLTLYLGCTEKLKVKETTITKEGVINFHSINLNRHKVLYTCKPIEISVFESASLHAIGQKGNKAIAFLNGNTLEIHIPKNKTILYFKRSFLSKNELYQQLSEGTWKLTTLNKISSTDSEFVAIEGYEPVLSLQKDKTIVLPFCNMKYTISEKDVTEEGNITFPKIENRTKKNCSPLAVINFEDIVFEAVKGTTMIQYGNNQMRLFFPDSESWIQFTKE